VVPGAAVGGQAGAPGLCPGATLAA
jgi:hypothetical protein